jgi:hypothetical protein
MNNEKHKNDETEERIREYNLKIAYKNGIIEGLRQCSWWEEGIQYVGMSKKTLESAIQEIDKEYDNLEP